MKRILSLLLSLIICFAIMLSDSNLFFAADIESSADNLKITEILPDKSRYNPGETAKLTVTVENESSEIISGEVKIYISHLENNVDTLSSPVQAAANASSSIEVEWTVPENDFTGYYVKAVIGESSASTAIDCSSDISVFPRYGYVGEYDGDATKTEQTANTVSLLSKKYHINAYQFYDWQWRHDDYVKYDESGNVAKEWDDLFQRKISSDTVKAYISAAQNCGSKALAYVQSYSARENYEEHGVSPEDGLYKDRTHSQQWMLDFGDTKLYQFNPGSENWQKKMISEYKKIVNDMGFDGLQIDQLGNNGTMYSYDRKIVDYGKGFAELVNATKTALNLNNQKKSTITFNMVGGWPADNILSSTTNTDFNFSELWGEHNSYNSVRNWTERARTDGNKAFVLAAYLNYYDNPEDGAFSEPSMRLTNATISASGASHIEIGAKENEITMLCNEYYPNTRLKLNSSHLEALKNYYDFITAYENLLYDNDIDYYADNTLEIDGVDISKNASAGKVWYMTRQNEKYDIIHLINLTGEDDDNWRNVTSTPQTKTDLKAKYYLSNNDTAKGVYLASPDSDSCESRTVEFTQGSDDNGKYIEFTLPSLEYWDMVYISKSNDNADAAEKYYDAYRATLEGGANRATNHTGYIGHGFVDRFGAVGTAVTFNVNVKTAGNYTLNFRYANSCGFGKDSYPTLYIDGERIQELKFEENGLSTLADYAGWNTWSENTEVATNLAAGSHSIKLIYERETNASNLDGLTLIGNGVESTTVAPTTAAPTTAAPTTAAPTTTVVPT
ncbi:MAG: glycoside hydrolase family 66 protein, partial [Acutalibacteraceae bacterium]